MGEVKTGRLRGLTLAVAWFYGTDREGWWGVRMGEVYRLRRFSEGFSRGWGGGNTGTGVGAGCWPMG